MTYSEAKALKESLTSETFISSLGNRMTICIVPQTPAYFGFYKSRLKSFWTTAIDKDRFAKKYAWDGKYTLYGIRMMPGWNFSGGILDYKKHPGLLTEKARVLLEKQMMLEELSC
jgi:hypothetical protein